MQPRRAAVGVTSAPSIQPTPPRQAVLGPRPLHSTTVSVAPFSQTTGAVHCSASAGLLCCKDAKQRTAPRSHVSALMESRTFESYAMRQLWKPADPNAVAPPASAGALQAARRRYAAASSPIATRSCGGIGMHGGLPLCSTQSIGSAYMPVSQSAVQPPATASPARTRPIARITSAPALRRERPADQLSCATSPRFAAYPAAAMALRVARPASATPACHASAVAPSACAVAVPPSHAQHGCAAGLVVKPGSQQESSGLLACGRLFGGPPAIKRSEAELSAERTRTLGLPNTLGRRVRPWLINMSCALPHLRLTSPPPCHSPPNLTSPPLALARSWRMAMGTTSRSPMRPRHATPRCASCLRCTTCRMTLSSASPALDGCRRVPAPVRVCAHYCVHAWVCARTSPASQCCRVSCLASHLILLHWPRKAHYVTPCRTSHLG